MMPPIMNPIPAFFITDNPGIDFSLAAKQLPGRPIITATSTKIISLMWDPLFENGTDVIVYVVSTKPAKNRSMPAEAPATFQAFLSTNIESDDQQKNFTFHAVSHGLLYEALFRYACWRVIPSKIYCIIS